MGEGLPVGHQAAEDPGPGKAEEEVPQKALVGPLLIGRDLIGPHPLPQGLGQGGGRLRLEQAVGHIHHVVAPGPEKADFRPGRARGDGKLHLIPITVRIFCAQNHRNGKVKPPDPAEGVLHPPALGLQLGGVGHVAELAAAAFGVVGAVGRLPVWGGAGDLESLPPDGRAAHLQKLDLADLPREPAGDKDHLALQVGDALTVETDGLDGQGEHVIFLGHSRSPLRSGFQAPGPAGPGGRRRGRRTPAARRRRGPGCRAGSRRQSGPR